MAVVDGEKLKLFRNDGENGTANLIANSKLYEPMYIPNLTIQAGLAGAMLYQVRRSVPHRGTEPRTTPRLLLHLAALRLRLRRTAPAPRRKR